MILLDIIWLSLVRPRHPIKCIHSIEYWATWPDFRYSQAVQQYSPVSSGLELGTPLIWAVFYNPSWMPIEVHPLYQMSCRNPHQMWLSFSKVPPLNWSQRKHSVVFYLRRWHRNWVRPGSPARILRLHNGRGSSKLWLGGLQTSPMIHEIRITGKASNHPDNVSWKSVGSVIWCCCKCRCFDGVCRDFKWRKLITDFVVYLRLTSFGDWKLTVKSSNWTRASLVLFSLDFHWVTVNEIKFVKNWRSNVSRTCCT